MRRCGFCEAELVGKRPDALYCDGVCRRAAWADRTGYRRGNGRERLRRPHLGGLQISYRKATYQVADTLRMYAVLSPDTALAIAERSLWHALSDRQRERLGS